MLIKINYIFKHFGMLDSGTFGYCCCFQTINRIQAWTIHSISMTFWQQIRRHLPLEWVGLGAEVLSGSHRYPTVDYWKVFSNFLVILECWPNLYLTPVHAMTLNYWADFCFLCQYKHKCLFIKMYTVTLIHLSQTHSCEPWRKRPRNLCNKCHKPLS